jgi:uncharacterized membrane protein
MKKLSTIEKMLAASLAFTFLLLAIRVTIAHQTMYLFYVWNLFLAAIPLVISRRLGRQENFNFKSCLLLMGWLLFFPNAPYIITDIFHYENRPPLPMWFDLLLVLNAAWSGLMLGLCSLLQVEIFLKKVLKPVWVSIYISGSLILCGYGIYLGRFLRFNSWDIITAPHELFVASFQRIFNPFDHRGTWGFSLLFGISLILFYYTLKSFNKLAGEKNTVE